MPDRKALSLGGNVLSNISCPVSTRSEAGSRLRGGRCVRLGQGRENSKAFLKANPDITAKIETSIRQNSGLIAEQILAGAAERDADGEEPAEE